MQSACPGPGACGGKYTANTMASAIEALGMAVPYSSSIPAWDPLLNGGAGGLHPEKIDECERASVALQTCIANDIKPRDIMTMKVHIRISYVYAYAYAYAYVCESARSKPGTQNASYT